jgi:hypothetical protein
MAAFEIIGIESWGSTAWNVVPVTFVCDFTSLDKALYAHT